MSHVKTRWWLGLVAIALIVRGACDDDDRATIRIATFNIEDFPKDARQVAGAFDELSRIDASVIALQEITDPERFAREARTRLGVRWQLVHVSTAPVRETRPVHHLGVLFDGDAWWLAGTAVHDETRLEEGRHKPTLEVRLRPRRGGEPDLRVLVVHLKAGSEGRPIRARQHAALRRLLRELVRSGDRVIVLGDFNATDDDMDRADLAKLAEVAKLQWATERLACTAFWARDDGCPRSRLDHAITWTRPARALAAGACATEGCDWQAACPVWAEQVSDHCPVVLDL
jgi:endonuclease/exonuclease/phosphatase family metal-dependent hydrolase